MNLYLSKDKMEVGVDEAGRGCLMGPVFAAAVIWNPYITDNMINQINDSKKVSRSKRYELREYIELNAIDFSVQSIDNEMIDECNILNSTFKAMHKSLADLRVDFDKVLVDGDKFQKYKDKDHVCIIGGDAKYVSIAAASILAKTYHDDWIENNCDEEMNNLYDFKNNMGYGTKKHIIGIENNGLTKYHRQTFCKRINIL